MQSYIYADANQTKAVRACHPEDWKWHPNGRLGLSCLQWHSQRGEAGGPGPHQNDV